MQWNEILFYKQLNDGNLISTKLVNITQGTEENHNISIVPNTTKSGNLATTEFYGKAIDTDVDEHTHFSKWKIKIYIPYFYDRNEMKMDNPNYSRVGAHELGHVLGLRDIDSIENDSSLDYHHEEVLMGYDIDDITYNKQSNITYRDIAGAAITMGIHTDADHIWRISDEGFNDYTKIKCIICNGTRNVTLNDDGTYSTDCGIVNVLSMKSCEIHGHELMLYACNSTKEYYKCKYCDYHEISDLIPCQHNYEFSIYNGLYHRTYCSDCNYSILQRHNYIQINNYSFNDSFTPFYIPKYQCVMCGYITERLY